MATRRVPLLSIELSESRYWLFVFMPGYFPNTLDSSRMACRKKPADSRDMQVVAASMPLQQKARMTAASGWLLFTSNIFLNHDLLANSGKVQEKMISKCERCFERRRAKATKRIIDTIKTNGVLISF
jgi:hypothetical protein